MRYAAALLCLAALTGCVSPLQKLREINPSADDFASSLASEYRAYSDSEAEQGRLMTAEYYADKGLRALKGKVVEPEVPPAGQDELVAARTQLMALWTDDMKRVAPQKLARAQLLYDCWQHEQARRISEELAPCADEFKASMAELQDVSDHLMYGQEKARVIDFPPHSVTLSDEAQATIREMAGHLAGRRHYTVELEAYIGIKASQRKLSETRLDVVRRALIREGVRADRIRIRKQANAKAVILGPDALAINTKKVRITIKTDAKKEAQQ
jgi:outer membrane protein OmpA-like peptidoglycan-associated protein